MYRSHHVALVQYIEYLTGVFMSFYRDIHIPGIL